MQWRIIDEARMDAACDASIREGHCECFPADREVFARSRGWHGAMPDWTVVLEEGGRVIAHAGVVERTIGVGGQSPRVAGVQSVFVLPAHRGRGLCRETVQTAMTEAKRRGLDFGLLFCTPQYGPIYERLGWRTLGARAVLTIDGDGRPRPIPAKNEGLFYPLRHSDFPPGDIDLRGSDW